MISSCAPPVGPALKPAVQHRKAGIIARCVAGDRAVECRSWLGIGAGMPARGKCVAMSEAGDAALCEDQRASRVSRRCRPLRSDTINRQRVAMRRGHQVSFRQATIGAAKSRMDVTNSLPHASQDQAWSIRPRMLKLDSSAMRSTLPQRGQLGRPRFSGARPRVEKARQAGWAIIDSPQRSPPYPHPSCPILSALCGVTATRA